MSNREWRIAGGGLALLGAALLSATTLPLLLLAVGPLIWGVPHLVADIRYLVARPRLYRAKSLYVAAAVVAGLSMFGFGVRAGIAAAMVTAMLSPGSLRRRATIAAIAGLLFILAQRSPDNANIVFLHAHNPIVATTASWSGLDLATFAGSPSFAARRSQPR
ncbi:MAG: hypothetical protein HOW73_40080 [Polyangiaceae bacterium]|nr:hypothetical protein [Polyangiaceae bacterium]